MENFGDKMIMLLIGFLCGISVGLGVGKIIEENKKNESIKENVIDRVESEHIDRVRFSVHNTDCGFYFV